MSRMPPTLAVIALDFVLIISPASLILIVSGCIISVTILPSGPLAIVIGILIGLDPCHGGFCSVF